MANMTAKGLEKLIRDGVSGRTPIGGGIYLTITQGGSASFGFRYSSGTNANGNQRLRLIGLGGFCAKTNTLGMARSKATDLKAMINKGIDPIEQSVQDQKRTEAANRENKIKDEMNLATFDSVALEYIESKKG